MPNEEKSATLLSLNCSTPTINPMTANSPSPMPLLPATAYKSPPQKIHNTSSQKILSELTIEPKRSVLSTQSQQLSSILNDTSENPINNDENLLEMLPLSPTNLTITLTPSLNSLSSSPLLDNTTAFEQDPDTSIRTTKP